MITTLYSQEDDREIIQGYYAHNHDIYSVPVAVANGDIKYTYRVDVYYPHPFDFFSKTRVIYTVSLGTNAHYIAMAESFGGHIVDDPYNAEFKHAELLLECDAHILTKYIAIQETIKYQKMARAMQ